MTRRKHPGADVFGNRACRECGYAWTTSYDDAVATIAGTPARYATLLRLREAIPIERGLAMNERSDS